MIALLYGLLDGNVINGDKAKELKKGYCEEVSISAVLVNIIVLIHNSEFYKTIIMPKVMKQVEKRCKNE